MQFVFFFNEITFHYLPLAHERNLDVKQRTKGSLKDKKNIYIIISFGGYVMCVLFHTLFTPLIIGVKYNTSSYESLDI